MADLEQGLRDLGRSLAYPATPDLAAAIRPRLVPAPARRQLFRPLAYALAALLALALLVALVPPVRDPVARFFGLRGVVVQRVPQALATPSPSASPLLSLGRPVSLDQARLAAGFKLADPPPALGPPDQVLLLTEAAQTAVTYVYLPRADLPDLRHNGFGALVTQLNADLAPEYLGKTVGAGTTVEEVSVGGHPGYWIEGRPHDLYIRRRGYSDIDPVPLRLAGNTLLWQRGPVLFRIELQGDRARAMEIAASIP